ncbi:hypothetical protein WS72_19090 [Burkholderia savannae]|uniref:Uncharacterized protein n=1 Tax=Burkholderia savannae TaxID=1637837 RepID=A0ABR5TA09_9BURK|nr:hypothetical protein WS72_19090 [Burkholderia savannae]
MPTAASLPDLLATRFIVLISRLIATEVGSAKRKHDHRQLDNSRYAYTTIEQSLQIIEQYINFVELCMTIVQRYLFN